MSSFLSDIHESLEAREKYIPPEWQFLLLHERREDDDDSSSSEEEENAAIDFRTLPLELWINILKYAFHPYEFLINHSSRFQTVLKIFDLPFDLSFHREINKYVAYNQCMLRIPRKRMMHEGYVSSRRRYVQSSASGYWRYHYLVRRLNRTVIITEHTSITIYDFHWNIKLKNDYIDGLNLVENTIELSTLSLFN